MYRYQLMLAKDWQLLQDNYLLSNQQSGYYSPKPKRIKYFYDHEYHDIVDALVHEPDSCKNFYPILQQVGLPYQSYYHKTTNKVAEILSTALYEEKVILIHQPQINGYSDNSPSLGSEYQSMPIIKKEPAYKPDDSWLIIDLVNHRAEQIQILDASNNKVVTTAQTSPDEIFLKQGDAFSSTKVLPKVHILLGGLPGNSDLALRGDKPLRVKTLAQRWLDELSELLRSGNSPFTIEQDKALASLINYGFSPQHYYETKKINEQTAFRPDETLGVFFYYILALLNHTDFITARKRIGTCGADEGEGAILDIKSLKQALKSLHNIRHSEGQDKADYAYHSNTLALTANDYLAKPLALDGTGQENDYESLLKQEIKHYTQLDQLTDIESLYFNAIKLLKHLREPGLIKHVETRREYQLKATKLDYGYVEDNILLVSAKKDYNSDVEAYLLTATGKITGLGTHSALYIHIKGESPLLFDPNGAFKRNQRGNAEFFYNEDIPFTIEEFVKYHNEDGDDITQRAITLTTEQAKNIEDKIFYGSFGGFFYCSLAVSEVLQEYGLQETYFSPLNLDQAIKDIEKRK